MHAGKLVGQSGLPGGVRADVIALNQVGGGRSAIDLDAIVGIAGNDIARAGGRSADGVELALSMEMPLIALPRALAPVTSTPMKLPWTRLPTELVVI